MIWIESWVASPVTLEVWIQFDDDGLVSLLVPRRVMSHRPPLLLIYAGPAVCGRVRPAAKSAESRTVCADAPSVGQEH